MSQKTQKLQITNAKENNLKDLSLEIPHDKFTVVTGISGSGKSSLAFSTVYAEGQRRYLETFSPYTRQFFDKVKKPNVSNIENIRPAIAIQQRNRISSSRSTVGSLTNINDYLRVLWSNIAKPVCPECHSKLVSWTASSLAKHLQHLESIKNSKSFLICTTIDISNKKFLKAEIDRLRTLGYSRFYDPIEGQIGYFEDTPLPPLNEENQLILALDRTRSNDISSKTLKDSLAQAFSFISKSCLIVIQDEDSSPTSIESFYSSYYCNNPSCCNKPLDIPSLRPSLFSFNHPIGACPECKGFGRIIKIDPELCIPNQNLSIADGAVHCWTGNSFKREFRKLLKFCETSKISTENPWSALTKQEQDEIFYHHSRQYRGIIPFFKARERKIYKMHVRVFLSRYRGQFPCPSCHGARLKAQALAFEVKGKNIADLWNMPISSLKEFLGEEERTAAKDDKLDNVYAALMARLDYLCQLGLSYLTLDRQARTLSGGETQRVNLAGALGSELVSTHFVLDEPSVGLHPRDTERLISSIKGLQEKGNSLLVVEHDLDCIEAADHVIELGPGAGENGGQLVAASAQESWQKTSLADALPVFNKTKIKNNKCLTVKKADKRNLKNIDVKIPINAFVCLTGVSGSGKSTLVSEVILRAYDDYTKGIVRKGKTNNQVLGFEPFEQVLLVDQAPLTKSPRANIATYTKIWDPIRSLLADTDDAQLRALTKSSFSFNVEGGRCPACKGAGHIKEDMQFLSDVFMPCELCLGKRFQSPVLEVFYKGKNVDDFMQLSVDGCGDFFHAHPSIGRSTEILSALGLGHLRLGHPLSELSGGEAQRLKLVPFLQKSSKGNSLLIFDEPTTGLHLRDVKKLIELFSSLVKLGHSILCIEHNPTLILSSDWIIDLGPEGGEEGGDLIKEGHPKDFIKADKNTPSYTSKFLQIFYKDQSSKESKEGSPTTKPLQETTAFLSITGAREHNLKNISIDIPLDKLVALTGVSGSGKSTIAKDIIYAEGQRRYLDCLSPYARQFIKELKRPKIDEIKNVRPTICVYQHTFQPSRLSTLATMSEIYNHLRLLFAKVGTQYCPKHPKQSISPMTNLEIAREIKHLSKKSIRILAPIIKMKKGYHKAVFERAVQAEITELRVDGQFGSAGAFEGTLERSKAHSIEYTVAKFNPANIELDMIESAVEQTLSLSGGSLIVSGLEEDIVYSQERSCPKCKKGFFRPDPEDLSFNSKRGACQKCSGSGKNVKGEICKACGGARLNPTALHVKLKDFNIHQLCLFRPAQLEEFLSTLSLSPAQQSLVFPIMQELTARIESLKTMGLDYLPLDRDCKTLSSGELQRLRLSTAIGSPLTGTMYIFDEPSVGLHPVDNAKVLTQLKSLKDKGNSVILIEHDSDTILSSDYIIDIGPGGGSHGGEIVFAGDKEEFFKSAKTTTAKELRRQVAFPKESCTSGPGTEFITIRNSSKNNIEKLSLKIPHDCLVTVAGVSGAGKSSLVHGIIAETIAEGKVKDLLWTLDDNQIQSTCEIDRVLMVDQKPIGKNSRSTPVSYLKIWDDIRKLFAASLEAKARGWGASFFSYNTGKGRCPECKGQGQLRLEMSFLSEAIVRCETCLSKRYTKEADSVKYLDLSISEVLELTFQEAKTKFANHKKIHQILHQACELGLGYLKLGQSSATLSGGESQRIKLVSELAAKRKGKSLYILDEPTTGLHKADVARLVKVLKDLIARGNSIILIEHDLDVIAHSDHIIELGPGPAEAGGKVIFQGPPAELAKADTPWGNWINYLSNIS